MSTEFLEKLIKGRRSVRKWKKQSVPDELLKKAIELATWAPNGGNFQGWHFVVVKNRDVIERTADAVQAVADKISAWPEGAIIVETAKARQRNVSFFRNAPVCIGVFVKKYVSTVDRVLLARETFDKEARRILSLRRMAPSAVQSTAAAVATLLLVLHDAGLGAVWLGAPLMAKDEVEAIMKAPADSSLVCLVAVGYPDESPKKERRPVEEILEFIP